MSATAFTDWRKPYRTMDASGSPECAEVVGWNWIGELAREERARDAALLVIQDTPVQGGGKVTRLYRGTTLLAVATTFRDEWRQVRGLARPHHGRKYIVRRRFAQPCFEHEYIRSDCPACGWMAEVETSGEFEGGPRICINSRFGEGFLRFACPGDEQHAPPWILRFADPDCGEQVFIGEDAEERAWEAWNCYAPSYNCWLFQCAAIAAATGTAKTPKPVECEASQSGGTAASPDPRRIA